MIHDIVLRAQFIANSIQPVERLLQRAAVNTKSVSNVPPIVHEVLRSPGQPLDAETRAFMEARFGHDFSGVRVHADAQAAASARAVGALAYTVGTDIVFGVNQHLMDTPRGKRLLAHELTHTLQQGRSTARSQSGVPISRPTDAAESQADTAAEQVASGRAVPVLKSHSTPIVQRDEFTPWPGQTGTDVPGTRSQAGNVIRERVQRTGDPHYTRPQPILLEFNPSTCTLTSLMEINFVHPADRSVRLSTARFNALKTRILSIANERLNGWVTIRVGSQGTCQHCRGQSIRVNVTAREGNTSGADTVELRSDTGRSNAGRIYAGGQDWFAALLGGVTNGTLWHEAGHIVLGVPDEYPPPAGDPPRPANRINVSDWSAMSTQGAFGRRSVMHPRHFSFMSAWLGRRFPGCTFDLVARPQPIVIDIVPRFATGLSILGGGLGFGGTLDLAAGIPLDRQRRLRLLLGGYASALTRLNPPSQAAFLAGALIGLDYSTNRSAGGFGIRGDLQFGGGSLDLGSIRPERSQWTPTLGSSLDIGYVGPDIEFGATGSIGMALTGPHQDDPYFLLGLRLGFVF